ncbi:recombinase family protein [Calidithermus roseus]|uniref:Recombinase n=1 Tax=Calidithermus roseus TaxID=1644118 RepID=A0A399EZT4_9DEIN|nr:recombinase family protein [Calidithermus roseus]RIH89273.1 hypothetical protein Mrose_00413 [Calidithermus roseus]
MKRFAEYLRFSSSPQDKLSSPEAHQRENRAYVERVGGVIVATYRDTISGRVRERAGLDQLLADCKRGLFDAVVIYDITRAGRKALVTHQIAEEIVSAGVELHSTLHGQYQFDDEMGEFRFGADALFAQVDYRRTVRRLYDARIQAAMRGEVAPTGRVPLGLRRTYHPLTGKSRLEIDPEGQELALRIFRMFDQGMTASAIAETLHREGAPTAQGGIWDKATILRMLRNRAFVGEWTHRYRRKKGGPITVTVKIPQVIPTELFERVQLRLATLKRGGPPMSRLEILPFTGMLFCHCGMRLSLQGNRRYPGSIVAKCRNRKCGGIGRAYYRELHAACIALASGAIKAKVRRLEAWPPAETSRPDPARKAAVVKRIERIKAMIEAGIYSIEEGRARLEAARAELASLEVPSSPGPRLMKVRLPKTADPALLRKAGVCFVVYPNREIVMRVCFSMS